MNWLYHRNYVGPDRRGARFQARFIERRGKAEEASGRASLRGALKDLFARGLKWVDSISYFGPDRRSGAFSHFFFERRRHGAAGPPPTLQAALRQLRVRVLDAEGADGRRALCERLLATSLLADARGQPAIGDLLARLASELERSDGAGHVSVALQAELLKAEAMLDQARP